MKKLVILLSSFIPLIIVAAGISLSSKSKQQLSYPYATAKIEIKSFRNDCSSLFFLSSSTKPGTESWGYDIYLHGVLYVHQPFIPGIDKSIGFKKREDAVKTAHLAISKIRNNISPFHITTHELDSLGVNNTTLEALF